MIALSTLAIIRSATSLGSSTPVSAKGIEGEAGVPSNIQKRRRWRIHGVVRRQLCLTRIIATFYRSMHCLRLSPAHQIHGGGYLPALSTRAGLGRAGSPPQAAFSGGPPASSP